MNRISRLATAVVVSGSVAGGDGPRHCPGPTRCSRAAQRLAGLSGGQSIRPMSLVPRGSAGADRQSSGVPGGLGCEHLPHLLVRPVWAGQCRAQHLGWRVSPSAASTSAAGHFLPVPALVSVNQYAR
jgi:hypothetical protein